ncbi:IdeS/Mac family cysteine endopeptidase [Mycoplasma phocoeninasale]|uniref:IdeS/Mac family cysteine endopeptidase n=1 Tax=Mycoplasma phocoeninasale TaxID=2726117 RepID=UPI0019681A6D|nr:IdeS/Mac family cysteine endopeptidase [Mycoplasma phocoeninasale]MBN0970906.1 IdeS/Mac family cysteine endopeptidase [Mycoplasma phocoeninasale]
MKKAKYLLILSTLLLTPLTAVACVVPKANKNVENKDENTKAEEGKNRGNNKSNTFINIKSNEAKKDDRKTGDNTKENSSIIKESEAKNDSNNIEEKNAEKNKDKENKDQSKVTEKEGKEEQSIPKLDNDPKNKIDDQKQTNNVKDISENTTNINNTKNQKIIESLQNIVSETRWVSGVNVDVRKFLRSSEEGLEYYQYPLRGSENEGWYDINKDFEGGDWTLCSANVASNLLHWWLDQNKKYVDKYIELNPEKAAIKSGDTIKYLSKIRTNYKDEDGYYDKSKIFDDFKNLFGGKYLWPDKLIDMFINGYKYSKEFLPNNESDYQPSQVRGFLKEVFESKRLSDFKEPGDLKTFSKTIKDWLDKKRGLAISYSTRVGAGHIITIWGADFDKDGNVIAIYISDSDNKSEKMNSKNNSGKKERVGMTRLRVDYSSGVAKLSSYAEKGSGAEVLHLYSIKNGESIWKSYFEKQNIEL